MSLRDHNLVPIDFELTVEEDDEISIGGIQELVDRVVSPFRFRVRIKMWDREARHTIETVCYALQVAQPFEMPSVGRHSFGQLTPSEEEYLRELKIFYPIGEEPA